jgi:hypothetical protein
MNIWIDDLRNPKDFVEGDWFWIKNSADAIKTLEQFKNDGIAIRAISFDHDLGGDDTTRPVILWMCENDFWSEMCYVHSSNPPGVTWLLGMINHYGPGAKRVSL